MVISVGECTPKALLQSTGVLTAEEVAALAAAGVVADTTGKFFTPDGKLAETDLNARAPSIGLTDLQRSSVTLLAAGPSKTSATRAVLAAGFVNRLIVDEALASALLNETGR